MAARVTPGPSPATAWVSVAEPVYGVAPGQAAVFYGLETEATRLLGGGWIRPSPSSP
ncbi:aminomethyltransferase beta-barrel domain-containing protein [Pararhodospirillum photometricum]|uniref:tRNA (5-methylaminomethyl-2-thiouridylate)-methyltransferase n=1 Tax=Pararhodospirillum photometricum DSM 122 TaxID=1150469 RepID=H6SN66_PARPM|nr:aminomethyltransferase beta-barrel domain-containing protein [Pararhodospirillum photometricum]CCG06942.1 tRNA (5-methylaminomethyl-2-thiouridylate)-methyltransferase [Pararhodospirillum photometricum DSM 122]